MYGISLYYKPGDINYDLEVLTKAATQGAKYLFLGLGADFSEDNLVYLKTVVKHANTLGIMSSVDVNKTTFENYNCSPDNLSLFKDIGLYSIRIDDGFSFEEECQMIDNDIELKIMVNSSTRMDEIKKMHSTVSNKQNILACFNFYPLIYTGMEINHFIDICTMLMDLGINTSTFVSFGLAEQYCTIEALRNHNVRRQIDFIKMLNCVDHIYCGDELVNENQFEIIAQQISKNYIELGITTVDSISSIEREILFDFNHSARIDTSDSIVRSSFPRIKYSEADIKPIHNNGVNKGDIVIINNNSSRYKGEVHIVRDHLDNTEHYNIVGKLDSEYEVFLNYLGNNQPFKLI